MGQAHSELDEKAALTHIQELYRMFASECPSGNLHLHEFKKIFGLNSDSTEEESAYTDNVFRSFDANHDNTLDFMEYVAAAHLVLRGKLEDRLRWSFKLYDRVVNGHLDKKELKQVVKSIQDDPESIQLDTEEEWEALILNPNEPLVTCKLKGRMLACKRWLWGRSLYCSKLLTLRARSRYLFLGYLLILHVTVLMCFTGAL